MKPRFFKTPADFREWLEENHETAPELLVGFYKVGTGKPSITWPQSVDEALCFGWIDGIRRTIDEETYSIRFTPRRPTSIWSAVNVKKMEELLGAGLVKPMGIAAYEKLKEGKTKIYSHERKAPAEFTKEQEKLFKTHKAAWEFFNAQAPYYKNLMKHWVTSAKQEKTQISRLEKLIDTSKKSQRIR
ncbi:YdeI/OmpD-associated family protein [Flavobacterium beibuense]|uniref:Bacteriocin-protection protein, YdeI/OmpD-associated family n=1 Tax=Flavobacterium beibuense TaxID=657326 RepID=A0A444W3M3_9FLAO|nr:YdeI/OmpD-associated family protein [Flavobacterium beibuense]RYJ40495.1 bacteriocin-protection protein, YdeI/OmpD-associated family [Flavobacterium beibuense]